MNMQVKGSRQKIIFFFILMGVSIVLYGPSLQFPFVYDDYARIVQNPGIQSLDRPGRFFRDRTVQAGTKALHRDNYRPLISLNYAVDYALWGLKAGAYRFENVLFHCANAFLLIFLAVELMGCSWGAGFVGGVLFLIHPVQTESVVWVASRSNQVALFFMLLGLLAWRRRQVILTTLCCLLALFSRENAVVFPMMIFITDVWFSKEAFKGRRYAGFLGLSCAYVGIRRLVLGQVAQAPLWGGTVISNLANVFKTFPLNFGLLIWPHPLTVTYSHLQMASSFWAPAPLFGFGLFILLVIFLITGRRRFPHLTYCLAFYLLLWLPGSNLIPLRTLFAERLVYPLMGAVALAVALGTQSLAQSRFKFLGVGITSCLFLVFSLLTIRQTFVWRNDDTLWTHATRVKPEGWFGWYSLGLVEFTRAHRMWSTKGRAAASPLWKEAEGSFIQALKKRPPAGIGGEIFLRIASINLFQGRTERAEEHARRALALRPDLKGQWASLRSSSR